MIRRATMADIPAIIDLACESVANNPLPLKVSRDGIRELLKQGIPGSLHFCWVGEANGKVEACVAAQTNEGFWHERMTSQVVLMYTRVPGLGIELLRQYAQWVKGRPAIKIASFFLEPDMDPRIERLIQRLGFNHTGKHMSFVRGLHTGVGNEQSR